MALRTANHRAFLMGEGKKRQELGVSTVIVSNHLTSCPLCGKWENKVLIDDVYSGGKKEDGNYPLVSEAIEKGLLHPNCRHNLNTFFEGISKIPSGEKKNFKAYELTQKQRQLERSIRKQKRIVAGTLDINNFNKEKRKLDILESKLTNSDSSKTKIRGTIDLRKHKSNLLKDEYRSRIDSKKWLEAEFSNEKRLKTHIKKHIHQYGNITYEEYIIPCCQRVVAGTLGRLPAH